jgi:hypothetical protein
MNEIQIDECVKLTRDIPELELVCGEVGFVRSIWLSSTTFYEVEFQRKWPSFHLRAVLRPNQISRDMKAKGPPLKGHSDEYETQRRA